MNDLWWQYRQWRFVADMDRDGVVTLSDAGLWVQWMFFMPGDALIAAIGPTALGRELELTQASFGGTAAAVLSVLGWLLAACALFYLLCFLVDAIDPTYRTQRRERREAKARLRRAREEREGIARRTRRGWVRREPR